MSMTALDLRLEEVARSLDRVVRENINGALDAVWSDMSAEDADYYFAIGESVPSTPKPYPARFFLGHHPSILHRPIEDYPNITSVAYRHRTANDTGDQYEVVRNTAYLEAFVVHTDESTVNRVAWRYAKALHRIIVEHRNMNDDEIADLDWTPNVDISNAAARRVEEFKEDVTYIQGCRLEFDLRTAGIW
jgi:hypothetical protein